MKKGTELMPSNVNAPSRQRPIRFGIMCSGRSVAAWEAECIRNLMAVEECELALLLIDDRPSPPSPGRMAWLRGLFDPKTILWRLYQRVSLNRASQSTQTIDLSAELGSVPELRCQPSQHGNFVQRFRDEEVAEVRKHELDFIMRFAFNILRGISSTPLATGSGRSTMGTRIPTRGTPPGFWVSDRRDFGYRNRPAATDLKGSMPGSCFTGFFKTDFGSTRQSAIYFLRRSPIGRHVCAGRYRRDWGTDLRQRRHRPMRLSIAR